MSAKRVSAAINRYRSKTPHTLSTHPTWGGRMDCIDVDKLTQTKTIIGPATRFRFYIVFILLFYFVASQCRGACINGLWVDAWNAPA